MHYKPLARRDRPARSRARRSWNKKPRGFPKRRERHEGAEGDRLMRIALITDAWSPQVNGVVRTPRAITGLLGKWGHELLVISPDQYRSVPCPSYPEIRLALPPQAAQSVHGSTLSRPMRSTSPPKARSGWRHGATASRGACRSPPPITPSSPNTSRSAPGCRLPGSGPTSSGSTGPPPASWSQPRACEPICARIGLDRLREWSRGVDLVTFDPGIGPPGPLLGPAAPDPALCRAGRGRKEHRSVPPLSPAGLESGGRRWPGACAAAR